MRWKSRWRRRCEGRSCPGAGSRHCRPRHLVAPSVAAAESRAYLMQERFEDERRRNEALSARIEVLKEEGGVPCVPRPQRWRPTVPHREKKPLAASSAKGAQKSRSLEAKG